MSASESLNSPSLKKSAAENATPVSTTPTTVQTPSSNANHFLFWENNLLVNSCVVFIVTLFLSWTIKILSNNLEKVFAKTKNFWDDSLIKALRKPIQWFIWIEAFLFLPGIFYQHIDIFGTGGISTIVLSRARMLVLVASVFWFIMRYLRIIETDFTSHAKRNGISNKGTKANIHGLAKVIRVILLLLLVFSILQTIGFPLNSLLAFGGLGTLAITFAAKDTLANFFGGLMIFMDKPFDIGDWIRSPDRDIEGTVEYIGWRLTRIRTFDKRPLFVPNSTFSTISIENPTRMHNRRIKKIVGLRYEDAGKVRGILKEITHMLELHPEIDNNALTMVNLIEFGDSSLNVMIYTFTKTTNWGAYQAIQQDILLKIIDIISDFGAECAFPSRTLYLPSGELTVKN
jgi:MscS family membrane protein